MLFLRHGLHSEAFIISAEAEKISTRSEMENKERKLFDTLFGGIDSRLFYRQELGICKTKGALVVNRPSEVKFRDTEMKIHVDGRYLCTTAGGSQYCSSVIDLRLLMLTNMFTEILGQGEG